MTESTPARGPDFLPYPLPNRDVAPAEVVTPELPVGSRWEQALEGLTTAGMLAISLGVVALACLLGLSLPGHRGSGALLASAAAVGALVAAAQARREMTGPGLDDSRALVSGGIAVAVVSALVSLVLLASHRSSVADQPPVEPPAPLPTAEPQQPSPAPSPTPSAPGEGAPTPAPPGASPTPGNGLGGGVFGVPSEPGGAPISDDPTAKGTLKGRVVNLSGAAVPGATVTITRADPTDVSNAPGCPTRLTTTTDAQGNYTVQLCQLGDGLGYHVVITSGTARAASDLYVNSGAETTYDVILPIRRA